MPEGLRRYLQPREGWLSAALLMVMLLSLSWSVQRAEWLEQTEFLVPIAFFALLLGAVLALSPLSVTLTLPISAVVGAGIVLWTIGGEYFAELSQGDRFTSLGADALAWVRILADRGYAPQLSPYAVGLGVLMWVTAFIAVYTMYRHHRVLDAILLVGALLIANMSSTLTDLFPYLVLFMLAALLLWLRAALIGREEGWQRRRVNENSEVPAAIMRSGLVFIAGSLVMASVLTTVAVAAPLTAVWNNLDTVWGGVRDNLDGFFGGLSNPESRFTGTNFGPSFRIAGEWTSSDKPVLTVAAKQALYLRAVTYDIYNGHGWDQTPGRERHVDSEAPTFTDSTSEAPTIGGDAFVNETIEIQVQSPTGRYLYSSGYPLKTFVPVLVVEPGDQPFLGAMKATTPVDPGRSYSMTVLLSEATRTELRAAGTDYPSDVAQFYLGTDGVTTRTRELAEQVVDAAEASNPFDQADALTRFLQGDNFEYRTRAPLPTDPNQDLVDYFLFDPQNRRVGFCEQYASAMVVMARTLGIPARLAVGYAPGERVQDPNAPPDAPLSAVWQVKQKNAHAWAELYFPGYGWQAFEATKSIRAITRRIGQPDQPGGSGGAIASPPNLLEPGDGEVSSLASSQPLPGAFRPGEEPPQEGAQGGNLLVIVGLIVLVLAIAAWRWRRSRRLLRFLAPGDRQWRRLAMAADRAGVAQRPSETIYEYAGWLEEQIPKQQPEIRTIADGKVWQSYSGKGVTSDVIARMETAWKNLQWPLVWLAVRRRLRGVLPNR
ncbi:MAG TPA: transglutaminaseTgpA domain-containing protein [Candidatus Limnocylindria bacterium]